MRPDVSEQLDGLRRILEQVVAPELLDPYPADILAGRLRDARDAQLRMACGSGVSAMGRRDVGGAARGR